MSQDTADTQLPVTLTIDIGGQGIKACTFNDADHPRTERVRVKTPRPASPEAVFEALCKLAQTMEPFDRISVGFPGLVVDGVVRTAPNLDDDWNGFELQAKLVQALKRPTRVINDADLQGFGAIEGKGLEMIITLGTGMGAALYIDGRLVPNLELGHHPFERGKTYEERLGQAALDQFGRKTWNKRLGRAIDLMRRIFNFRVLYIGGGNARCIKLDLPADVVIVPNAIALMAGVRLWEKMP